MSMYLFVFMLPVLSGQMVFAAPESKAVLTVKVSSESEMETQLTIINNKVMEALARKTNRKPAPAVPVTDTTLTLKQNGGEITYLVDLQGDLFDTQSNEMIEMKANARSELMKYVAFIRASHFGEIVQWDKAKGLIPKKTKFKVVDIETGLSFNVQRRAGKHHADVQPLTKEDTAVMKQIYNGKWSWQRKAILVQAGDKWLAASMHGMPHGGDGIPDNNFSGHFCIHFLGSTTHGSGNLDPEHQLMVFKAGGKLDEYFAHASPYAIVDAYFNAFNFHDSQILKMSFSDAKHPQLELLFANKDQITGIRKRVKYMVRDCSGLVSLEIPIEVGIKREGRGEETVTLHFQMKRASLNEPWKIGSIDMIS